MCPRDGRFRRATGAHVHSHAPFLTIRKSAAFTLAQPLRRRRSVRLIGTSGGPHTDERRVFTANVSEAAAACDIDGGALASHGGLEEQATTADEAPNDRRTPYSGPWDPVTT